MNSNAISLRISMFLADNGLYGAWKRETSSFVQGGWRGRRDNLIAEDAVRKMLEAFFSEERDALFTHFFSSDYKHTYVSRAVLFNNHDVYLKHYKMHEAPRKIRARNILRRTLAKKAMCLYYELKSMGIDAVQPLFYARKESLFVPVEAVFASVSAGTSQTLEAVLLTEHSKGDLLPLARSLGTYVGTLHMRGVLYGELVSNLLPVAKEDAWHFVLCDLDEIHSLGGMTKKQQCKYLAKLRRKLFAIDERAAVTFDEAYHAALQRSPG